MDHQPQQEVAATDIAVAATQPENSHETTSASVTERSDSETAVPGCTTSRIHTRWNARLKVGEHVSFIAEGIRGSGTIDAVMPDNSVIWIWADGGLGRRMLHPGAGTSVDASKPQLETA